MYILDSNIIIYSAIQEYQYLREIIKSENSYVSLITKLEVLGFNKLDMKTKKYFQNVFFSLNQLQVESDIIELAINLRQNKKFSIGDSIIAASALKYDYLLYTRNINDFNWIKNLKLNNPIL
jgi:toxin FitB